MDDCTIGTDPYCEVCGRPGQRWAPFDADLCDRHAADQFDQTGWGDDGLYLAQITGPWVAGPEYGAPGLQPGGAHLLSSPSTADVDVGMTLPCLTQTGDIVMVRYVWVERQQDQYDTDGHIAHLYYRAEPVGPIPPAVRAIIEGLPVEALFGAVSYDNEPLTVEQMDEGIAQAVTDDSTRQSGRVVHPGPPGGVDEDDVCEAMHGDDDPEMAAQMTGCDRDEYDPGVAVFCEGEWTAVVKAIPSVVGTGGTRDEAMSDLVSAAREYAFDWNSHLRHAPNHVGNRRFVRIVVDCDDDALRDWLTRNGDIDWAECRGAVDEMVPEAGVNEDHRAWARDMLGVRPPSDHTITSEEVADAAAQMDVEEATDR
ncbi:hypothetical protein [Xylanimonas ulmi]|uniref:hypothetical protein n=1 Tax=Xylanimonas ulmi TaxID=228973 RepID=UPI00102ABD0A|nr:hypothetical protein [Xylanibacterium ulmi]